MTEKIEQPDSPTRRVQAFTMKMSFSILVFYQMCIVLIAALIMYVTSSISLDFFQISLALIVAAITFIYFIYIRIFAGLGSMAFSASFFFVLSFIIVFFQQPLDFTLGSFSENSIYYTSVYDESILIASVWYAVIFFIILCLGMHYQALKIVNKPHSDEALTLNKIPEKPFLLLFYLFLLLHLVTINPAYYTGNASEAHLQGLAGSIFGYFNTLVPICFAVITYNLKLSKLIDSNSNSSSSSSSSSSIFTYLQKSPKLFLIVIIIFSFFTFLAGDRGPAIRALILLLGSYYISTGTKVSFLKLTLMILFAGFFLSTIKLIGAINYNEDLIKSFIEASERLSNSTRSESISPYTAELAGSFRAYNISFSLWNSGVNFHALGVLTGLLMSIPYGVSLFMQVTGLEKEEFKTAFAITELSGESYGLGTTLIGDSLLNIGFIPTLILAFYLGRLFLRADYYLFIRTGSIYAYAFGLYLLMISIGLSRGSIFPSFGKILFIFFVIFFIKSFVDMTKQRGVISKKK